MRLLLGFGNKARQGKDSAATAIATYFNSQFPRFPEAKIFKFADALYQECRREHGMVSKDAPLLQRIGAERRKKDPNHWIYLLDATMKDFKGIALITDVRYLNEASWIRSRGGILINVSRLEEDGSPFVAGDRDPNHPSETELDGYPWNAFIKTYSGQEALSAEQAITIANYFFQVTERAR